MKKIYLSFLLLYFSISAAWATHIVGGEFQLRMKGRGSGYELILNLYFDDINGNKQAEDANIIAAIYSKRTNQLITTVVLPRVSTAQVEYTNPACTNARLQTRQIKYATDITLSGEIYNDPEGYYVSWERCCRNNVISNVVNPQSSGMTFYLEFPAVVQNNSRFSNNSPEFSLPKGDYACINEPFVFDFGAKDVDGDQLTYKLVEPYKGNSTASRPDPARPGNGQTGSFVPGPYSMVLWAPGININNVIPGSSPLRVNASTGQLTFTASKQGLYVFSVLCEEFRNGKKIGEVRRDFQLMVIDCPKNSNPKVRLREPGKSTFYTKGQVVKVKPTDSRCFDLAITDENLREQINLQLLPLNFPSELVKLTPTQGAINGKSDTLRAQLCWEECAYNKPGEPFKLQVIASDNGCPLPRRDTLEILLDFEQKPNNIPTVTTTLANNRATVIARNTLNFDVTGSDLIDNDLITLEAIGRGFDLVQAGMSFTNGSATGSITTPFVWLPDCDKVGENQIYTVDFIVKDSSCPQLQQRDTVTVILQFQARQSQLPEVVTTLDGNHARLFTNQEIRFDVIATDADEDPIILRAVGRGFTLEDIGMQFKNNQKGIGKIVEPFLWKPSCENTTSELQTYVIDFIVEDNSCGKNRFDTVTVTIDLSDFEVVFDEFLPPNVFTPNNDGTNDTFHIPNLPVDNCKDRFENIEIYNRWGKLVYKGDNREFSWSGIGFPTGVYFYLIHYQKNTYKGTVSLLR